MGKLGGRGRLLIVAVIAALVVVPAVLVFAQQRAASAATVLSILDGSASVARGAAAFVVASDGDIVNTGDLVRTAERSHAMVTFFDGSTLEIEPATTVQIDEAASAAGGAIAIRISQTIGRTWASVQKLTRADSKFEVRTPTLTAAVRGTAFVTEVLSDGTSSVQTTEGTVQVTGQGQSVFVTAGQTTTAPPNAPPSVPAGSSRSNTLRFGMHSPAYLAIVDPFGRACGIVLPGPTLVRQIPGCVASEPGSEPQLVDVPNAPAGAYQIYIASTAPGGAFTVTASAVDGAGGLSFNYVTSGAGQPGDKFASRIDVEVGADGALRANGFGPLTVIETAPVKVVRAAPTPKATASAAPDASLFSPLPVIGFAVGTNSPVAPALSTNAPSLTNPPLLTNVPGVTVGPLPSVALPTIALPTLALPTVAVPTVALPTVALPTVAVPTLVPQTLLATVIPSALPSVTSIIAPTPTPTPTPMAAPPTPTPQPTPPPQPATLTGGIASPGGTLSVLGTNWTPGAAITIRWPDGTQVATADVQTDGRFATVIRVPQTAPAGTYRVAASGGGQTATADVDVVIAYSPSLTVVALLPPLPGASVTYTGAGWPPNSSYSVTFDGKVIGSGVGGVTSAAGTFQGSFVVPPGTTLGSHTIAATSGGYSASTSLLTL